MTVRFGLLGAGRIGKVHAKAIRNDPQAQLVAVADAMAPAAETIAKEYGCDIRTVEAIEAASDIDAVVICTPTDTHADLIERFARAGKAIFCEKPIDLSVARVRDCLKVVKAEGATLMVGFNRRFDPDFMAVKAAIDAGSVGDVEMVTISSRDPGAPPVDYIRRSGGIFRDMTIHDFDMARWLLGEEPETVIATAAVLTDKAIGEAGDWDSVNVLLQTSSGRQAVITNSRRATYRLRSAHRGAGVRGRGLGREHARGEHRGGEREGVHAAAAPQLLHDALRGSLRQRDRGLHQGRAVRRRDAHDGRGRAPGARARGRGGAVGAGRAGGEGVGDPGGDGDEAARRHHHRPVLGGPLRRPGGRPAGGHGVVPEVCRRVAHQHGDRDRAAGAEVALITRVGDEHMGRFLLEELAREGVDTRGIVTDPERLTALVILGIRDQESFPLIFYRTDCADMALCEDDIDPAFIAEARSFVATGTHLSHPRTEAAVLKALRLARANGARTALDIDYRPNLWGLAGHGAGESRFIESAAVTAKLQAHLELFDLIVGTEEEFHIAGGSTDTLAALRAVRAVSPATLVCKRGAKGAVAFTGRIPDSLDEGEAGPGFPIEVFNVLGAGDGFMSGLLKGWLDDEPWPVALEYANACGAFAVSRHGCTPAYPSLAELEFFLARGVKRPDLRNDAELEQVHWATNRHGDLSTMRVFAFDHRKQMEEMEGATPERIGAFKLLCLQAAQEVAGGRPGYGILCDGRLGRDALYEAAGSGLWVGRPVELPGSRPLRLEPEIGPDLGGLSEWPLEQVVKVLCFCHPDDDAAMWADQEATLVRLFAAARRNRLEVLLEVIPSKVGSVDDDTTATIIDRIYGLGLHPDWWKLEPFRTEAAWDRASRAIHAHDPHVRGIVVLGLDASAGDLATSFALAAQQPLVKGFAVGRTIFADAARTWFRGEMDDASAVGMMAERFAALAATWDEARSAAAGHKEQAA